MSEQNLFEKWAAEVQKMRIEHEAEMTRETAKAYQKGRRAAQGYAYDGWTWQGGRFTPPPVESPTEAL